MTKQTDKKGLYGLGMSRKASFTLFGASLAVLLAGGVFFLQARAQLSDSVRSIASAKSRLAEADARLKDGQLKVQVADSARQMMDSARFVGLDPRGWADRRVLLKQQHLMRTDAAELLKTIKPSPANMFMSEEFEISVTKADEGLFEMPKTPDQPLMMTIQGTQYFRTTGAQ